MSVNTYRARVRLANELGATRCTPFAVLSVGPAKVDIDRLHEQALAADRFHDAMGDGHPNARCCLVLQ